MNILFVIDSLGRGGAERSLAELLPRLREVGIESTIACFMKHPAGVHDAVEEAGYDIQLIREPSWAGRALQVRRLIAARRPSLIHTALTKSNFIGRFAAFGTGVPVLSSVVNISYGPARYSDPRITPWKLKTVQTFDAWTTRFLVEHLHAVSYAVKDAAVTSLGVNPESVTVVERGRDPNRFILPTQARRQTVRKKLGLNEAHEVLLNVGRQDFQKAQGDLLEITATLLRERPNLVTLIAGREGTATSELKAQQKALGLEEHVRFLGHRDDVPDLLAAADVFVFPSLFEGVAGAVIEAMAMELPVVASSIAPHREVTEEGRSALLVPPSDACALAEAVTAMLDDSELAEKFGTRGREIFEENFTQEQIAERMIALYRKVSQQRRRP